MNTVKISSLLLLGFSLLLGGCTLPFSKQQYAGLQVDAEPQSAVYIDDIHVGETNYSDTKLKPGERRIKLSPQSGTASPWETRIKLITGLTTVIKRTFGNSPQESSNYVIQLEKISTKKTAELSIITTPENVIVRIDDQPKGFSPLINLDITAGSHKITLSAPGYRTENVVINPVLGYRLLLNAELGKSLALQPSLSPPTTATPAAEVAISTPSASPKPTTSPTPKPTVKPSPSPTATPATLTKPYVEILTTPTGWLRVRSEPNGLAENEVAKVNTGETYPYLETNETGWHKIEYAPGKQGWVAANYTKVVKE